MKRVALAWEQGGNAGHALRLCRLCDELERAGAAPVWALPPHRRTAEPIASDKRPHVTAPNVVAGRLGAVLSFADLLVAQGFLRREYLVHSIREWHAIWTRERIDALVSDYAPVAQLAALLAGVPVLQVTNGFDCPSPDVPIFGTRFGGEYFVQRNATTVAALERSLDDVGREFQGRVSLRDLFGSASRIIDCVAEADPHGPRLLDDYVGPLGRWQCTAKASWSGGAGLRKGFAYLRDRGAIQAFAAATAPRDWDVFCVSPGWTGNATAFGPKFTISAAPVNIELALQECDAVFNYGSSTVVSQTIIAGRPQLMMPSDIEKWTIAANVEKHGLGRLVLPMGDLGTAIDGLGSGLLTDRAVAVATQYARLDFQARFIRRVNEWLYSIP